MLGGKDLCLLCLLFMAPVDHEDNTVLLHFIINGQRWHKVSWLGINSTAAVASLADVVC